ncbi:MAG: hypothetical protein SWK76_02755, partial [Actinomycetota bacterium]|nr:hypothetical protein [Actinomycetota bacterium]
IHEIDGMKFFLHISILLSAWSPGKQVGGYRVPVYAGLDHHVAIRSTYQTAAEICHLLRGDISRGILELLPSTHTFIYIISIHCIGAGVYA